MIRIVDWISVSKLPPAADLQPLVTLLRQQDLEFRVVETPGYQSLEVRDPALVEPLQALVDRFLSGDLESPRAKSTSSSRRPVTHHHIHVQVAPSRVPLTLVLIGLSLLGALLVYAEMRGLFFLLTFTPIAESGQSLVPLSVTLESGQWWRLLTPAFLHFGPFHVAFNALWLWELGRRLELGMGWPRYLLFVVFTGVAANVAQYFWSGPSNFGGMSGVVYALVGFIWLRQKFAPERLYSVAPGLIVFMLVFLVIGLVGVVDIFIDGAVANGAHVGGLVAGMLLGFLSGIKAQSRSRKS